MLVKAAPKHFQWRRAKPSPLVRQIEVFSVAGGLLLDWWFDSQLGRNASPLRARRAQRLVNKLLALGPTFVKIGQSLSTRADLLPREYVEALSQLQDRVPAFNNELAIAIVEAELGSSLYALYRDFDRIPLASASLGQVHKAQLHTGEEVVVKVQRPGLEDLFHRDAEALAKLLQFCRKFLSWTRKYNLEAIYEEFFKILYLEIDYINEGKNAERFAENFKDYPRVRIPKVYWRYTSKKVLTVEYLPGIKIDDRASIIACGCDPTEITQIGICCYLKQLLIDGFFQADPHPGNMAIAPHDGSIIFYDFGMMSDVNGMNKDQMARTFFAVLKKDTNEVVNTLVSMGLIEPVSDMTPVRRLVAFLLEKFTEKPVDIKAFGEIRDELYVMFEQQPFRLPAQMTYVIKALTTLDGIARILDPQYNLMAAAQPFVKSLTVGEGRGNFIRELARQTRDFLRERWQQPSPAERAIRRLEERIERGELELRVRSIEGDRALKRLNLGLKALIYACLLGFTCLCGAVLLVGNYASWAVFAFATAGVWLFFLLKSLLVLSLRERADRLAR